MCLPKARWWAWPKPIPIDRGQGSARLEDQIAPKHDEVELTRKGGQFSIFVHCVASFPVLATSIATWSGLSLAMTCLC
jgi:hypothetical protein